MLEISCLKCLGILQLEGNNARPFSSGFEFRILPLAELRTGENIMSASCGIIDVYIVDEKDWWWRGMEI